MPLHRAIYVSDAVGDAGTSLLVLAEILGASSRHNQRDRVTGVLMRHDGRFLQAIEGRRADVDRLMERLYADRRHENIRLLADYNAPARLFATWPMTLVKMPPPGWERLSPPALDRLSAAQAEALLLNASQALALPA